MNEDFSSVLDIVRSVRPLLLPHWGKAGTVEYKEANNHGAVTYYDRESERILSTALREKYPDIGFVGEESGGDRTVSRFWLADPIDGTVAFIEGKPYCTTMLGLIEEGKQRLGVIYDFVTDTMYHAEKGKGAYEENTRIHVSDRMPPDIQLGVETHDGELLQRVSAKYPLFKTMTAGHEFVQVAKGAIEGRVCFNPFGKDYDFAPGTLLVAEAGGIVANIGKNTYDYTNLNFIAANKPVYEALTKGSEAIFPIA